MRESERGRPRLRRALLLLLVAATLTAGPGAGAQSAPGGPADPAAVRDRVREVMSRPEFSYEPSWIERVTSWIGEQLQKLFGNSEGPTPSGSFGGGVGMVVAWVLMLAAIAALVFLVVRLVVTRGRIRSSSGREPLSIAEVEHRRSATDWQADAERFESTGAWKEAVRARYRHLVRVLVDRRQLPDLAGMTTGELRLEVRRSTSGATDDFDTCCLLFELPWYADVPTGPEENARFRAAAERVLAAPVESRFELDLLPDVDAPELEPVTASVSPGDDR